MISEWLYWYTCQIGYGFNNAVGFENNQESNLLTGITIVWFLLIMNIIMLVIVFIYELKRSKV